MASLAIVMMLFLVVSLALAYANRGVVLEQRTASNQVRYTQAFEQAQAGLDWVVAQVNGGRVDDQCRPSTNAGDPPWRERALDIDARTGIVTAHMPAAAGDALAMCLFDGAGWQCACPRDGGTPSPGGASGTAVSGFAVRLVSPPDLAGRAGVVRVESLACAPVDAARRCLHFDETGGFEGRVRVSALLGLHSGLKTPPAAALTARQGVSVAAGTLTALNPDAATGLAVLAGQAVSGVTAAGPAGTPAAQAVLAGDPWLAGLAAVPPALPSVQDRMFAAVFGLPPARYRDQPAAVVLGPCSPCDGDALRALVAAHPGRIVWVDGSLALGAGDIGSATAPVMLVVDGNLTVATGTPTVFGAVYVRAGSAPWSPTGTLAVRGAALAENGVVSSGTLQVTYDAAIVEALRWRSGSFVVVPQSWRDF